MAWPSKVYNKGKGKALAWLLAHVGYQGDDCLPWPFSSCWNGYGSVSINGKIRKAHRAMCELAHGEPPTPRHLAAHSCNNGHLGCVNQRHLSWKTPRENMLDRQAAGTLTKKRWTNKGRVTEEDRELIRLLKPFANQREIAAIFDLSYQHISLIQRGLKRQPRKKRAA